MEQLCFVLCGLSVLRDTAKNKDRAVTGVGSGAAVDRQGERALLLYGPGSRTP